MLNTRSFHLASYEFYELQLLQYFPSRWKQAQGKTLSAYPYILFPSVILAFYSELKIDPTEYQILLTDPPLNPSKNREKCIMQNLDLKSDGIGVLAGLMTVIKVSVQL
ncbi:hypothetical protein DVH24_030641 [Malus domestica]|uniref:Uncharacterized protein n=1 Tax=Malus domestica TaxID=3750 RepID=A0A498JXN5_MALDO|nr:hypothetical protein DVH24_030641 [Malus domestica]